MDIAITSADLTKRCGIENAYRMIAEAGFTGIDWGLYGLISIRGRALNATKLEDLCVLERPLGEILANLEPELAEIRKNGLAISQIHTPFPFYFHGREDIFAYCKQIYEHCIELSEAVGCRYVVIHGLASSARGPETADDPTYLDELNRRMYESLIPVLQKANVIVCMENLYHSAPCATYCEGHASDPHLAVAEIDELNQKAGKECFGLCMDTGHLNMLGRRFYSYVPVLGHRLKCLHVHDNPGNYDSHLTPYSGTILWSEFTEELRKIGYEGPMTFEVGSQFASNRLPEALIPAFLKLTCTIGEEFREKITEKE